MKKNMWSVITAVFSLEVSKGHLKWSVSDLARMTGVNRTLIYYRLGKTKAEIFDNCLEAVAAEFYGLSPERMKLVREGFLMDCVHKSRQMYQEHPEFMTFYVKWRTKKSPVQQKLVEIEKRYQNKLKEIFPECPEETILSYHAILHGLVSSPLISKEVFVRSLDLINFPVNKAPN